MVQSSLNFKVLWASPRINQKMKQYFLIVLKICLSHSLEIYKLITSPDVDVDNFASAIMDAIVPLKKQIPRCDNAFAAIENSLGMLKENFGGYYKDFVRSRNPSTIIESFVKDVSSNKSRDARTAREFRTIIRYYQKQTAGKIKDPRTQSMFDALGRNFSAMERDMDATAEIAATRDGYSPTLSDDSGGADSDGTTAADQKG